MRIVVDTQTPVQLGTYLRGKCGVSARLLGRLKRVPDGMTRDGVQLRSIDLVDDGDVVELRFPNDTTLDANAALIVPVAYERAQVVVFDKPAGMPVHPSVHHRDDTLGNAFAARYPSLTFRPVNRLDSDTSGLCLVAKTAYAAQQLQHGVKKTYTALVCGTLTGGGTISAPIARAEASIIKRCVRLDGRAAVTHYTVCGTEGRYTRLRLWLETGRTHQIRVHMAYIGHPLAGDALYGGDCTDYTRHALHCDSLTFTDPETGAEIELSSTPDFT